MFCIDAFCIHPFCTTASDELSPRCLTVSESVQGMKDKALDKVEQAGNKLEQQRGKVGGKMNTVIDKVEHGLGKAADKITQSKNSS